MLHDVNISHSVVKNYALIEFNRAVENAYSIEAAAEQLLQHVYTLLNAYQDVAMVSVDIDIDNFNDDELQSYLEKFFDSKGFHYIQNSSNDAPSITIEPKFHH